MSSGRPPRYKTVEEMQEKIDQYFEACEGKLMLDEDGEPTLDKYGNEIYIGRKPPTVTGLALALGFNTRQALLNYQAKKAFVDTVTRAKSRIEEYAEMRLFDRDGVNGAKFSLTYNFKGWQGNAGTTEQDQKIENNLLARIKEDTHIEGEKVDI